jgi:cytoskeletal protein CcmA (bactofilin family)
MIMAFGSDRSESREGAGRAGTRGEAALTIVATGTRLVGDVESDGVVKVEGEISGTIRAERQVLVARGGVVRGDIITSEAVLGGEVHGGITASDRVEVQAGAAVHGDISTNRLIVQEGGEVNGVVKMAAEQPATPSGGQDST